MNNSLTHRGPDDSGLFFSLQDEIGLAHRRLSIIDLSYSGVQPMWDYSKSVVIVFNGEIYNYKELRSQLILEGYSFRSHSDTEVILNLYLRDGVELLSRLNGIFSFGIWDSVNKQLFLARDGVGVKPLYYTSTSKGLVFASEIKAILQEESVGRSIDYNSFHCYLSYLWCPAPNTAFKNIKKLEPGHALLVKRGEITKKWKFYELPYDQPISDISPGEAVEELQGVLKKAVQRQLVADVEVGAFLSGGLDSSTVVALARNSDSGKKFKCFTIDVMAGSCHQEGMVDDLSYAVQVANFLDVDLYKVRLDYNIINHLETMIYQLDEPQADPASIHVMLISKLARSLGIKVLLSGTGGDDIFTGYRRHYALSMEKYWGWLPGDVRSLLSKTTGLIPRKTAIGRRIAKALQYADLEGDRRIESYFRWIPEVYLNSLYSEDFQGELKKSDFVNPMIDALARLPPSIPPTNRMLFLDGKFFLTDHNLNYTDKMSMAVGVEVRVPFLDPDLISLAARLPVQYKQHGREGKWILKKAMESVLPHKVVYRPKTGFGAPIRGWLRKELRPVVEELLSVTNLRNRGLFDPVGVSRLVEDDRAGKVDGGYIIFSLMCLELWCRIFIDNANSRSSGPSVP